VSCLVQAWTVGDERAEAYLRPLGEGRLRRAGDRLRDLDAASGEDDLFRPGRTSARIAEDALRKVRRAGRILATVGAVDEDFLVRFASDARGVEHRDVTAAFVIGSYHELWNIKKSFRMSYHRHKSSSPGTPFGARDVSAETLCETMHKPPQGAMPLTIS
jgi:hypothetical protein